MSARASQGGFLSIVVLMMIVVVAALVVAMGYLVGVGTLSGSERTGSMRAFFLAESGLEYQQFASAQNLEWYRTTSDPTPAAPVAQALGAGTFVANTAVPATLLKTQLTVGGTALNAYTSNRFPASGYLQVDDDVAAGGEYVSYTGVAGSTFTGLARGIAIGTVTTTAVAHDRSSTVYPVTILRTSLAANCTPLGSMQVDANSKFLSAGTLDVEGEEIGYNDSSTSGGTTTLVGITRCLGLVNNVSHAIGQPVTPVLVGGDSADYQAEISATGTVGPDLRYAKRTIQR